MLPETSSMLGYGLLGGGALFLGIMGINWIMNKDPKKKTSPFGDIHKLFQKEAQNKIESIDRKQAKVIADIKTKETLSEKTQSQIRDIIDDASQEIDFLINKDMTIEDVHNEIRNMR